MKRKSRKNCIYSRGVFYYKFDFNKELIIYKYLCGEKLTKKQWKYLNEDNSFDFYRDWKSYIRQKCQDYDKDKLIEFCRYLEYRKWITEPRKDYWEIAFSAFMGGVLFGAFEKMLNEMVALDISQKGDILWKAILPFLIFSAVIAVLAWGISSFMDKLTFVNIEKHFLEDYKNIVQELLREREGE